MMDHQVLQYHDFNIFRFITISKAKQKRQKIVYQAIIKFIFNSCHTMTTCHQDICPHMHFNKCYAQRIRSIPVSLFPDPTIDSFTNVNVKCGKQYKSNIPTVAYEKFIHDHEATNDDRNFVKDFYMENFQKDKILLNNNIVNETKEEMYKNSAYVLAQGATKDYNEFEDNRKRALTNARNRAKSAYIAHSNQLKEQKQKSFQDNGYWLKKLFRKLEQVAKHIIQGGHGQDAGQRQKQFLLSKQNLTANFLSQIKIRQPKNAYEILEELRILMQKKKLKFSDQREEQQRNFLFKKVNKSVSQSFASEASQNTSQNSMLSEATSMNQTQPFGQDQVVGKFWDFNALKKKWNLQDMESVKQMIRRILAKKIVFDAELEAVKKRNQAAKLNKQLIRMNSTKKSDEKKQDLSKKRAVSQMRKKIESVVQKKVVEDEKKLSKEQEEAKRKIIEGGRFDAIGQKFLRNKTFSQIFQNKENDLKAVFVQKPIKPTQASVKTESKLLASTKISLTK